MMNVAVPKPRRRAAKAPTTADPIEIAMEALGGEASADSPARRVLVEQVGLIRAQRRSENFGAALKVLTGAAGVAVVISLVLMAWAASRADGLVIRAFSVPPSLAARGVSGEAVASQLMDRLSAIGRIAQAAEPQRRMSGDWGQNISIQIPETGVSLSQLDQWLRDHLGHERQVTGELMLNDDGALVLVTRSGSFGLPDQAGAGAQLPALLQRTAEALYAHEQPESYSWYLQRQDRQLDGIAHARTMIASRITGQRARGYVRLGFFLQPTTGVLAGREAYRRAIALDPLASLRGYFSLASIEADLGHPEEADRLRGRYLAILVQKNPQDNLSAEARRQRVVWLEGLQAAARGDFGLGLKRSTATARIELLGFPSNFLPAVDVISSLAGLHDIRRARAVLGRVEPQTGQQQNVRVGEYAIAAAAEDWAAALAVIDAVIADNATLVDKGEAYVTHLARRAVSLARTGRLAEAQAQIEATPLDCQPCVASRGIVAALAGDQRQADHWLGQSVSLSPTLPQPPLAWGRVMMERGDAAGAVGQFQVAHQRGPRWADPLTYWGESLLQQGHAKAAAAKFRQASRLAPDWGRNEMLWGAALAKLGKRDQASAHWRTAATLFLTPAERVELARLQGGTIP